MSPMSLKLLLPSGSFRELLPGALRLLSKSKSENRSTHFKGLLLRPRALVRLPKSKLQQRCLSAPRSRSQLVQYLK